MVLNSINALFAKLKFKFVQKRKDTLKKGNSKAYLEGVGEKHFDCVSFRKCKDWNSQWCRDGRVANTWSHPADRLARLVVSSVGVGHSQVHVRYVRRVVDRDSEGEAEIDWHYEVEGQAPVVRHSQCEQLNQWNRKDHEERCLDVDSENENWNSYHK